MGPLASACSISVIAVLWVTRCSMCGPANSTINEHDDIFAYGVANDSGANDGTGVAVVQDLRDNFIVVSQRI